MLMIPREELELISAAGILADGAAALPVALGIGAAAGSSNAIKAAGGLRAFASLGAATGGVAIVGLTSSLVLGLAVGNYIGETASVRGKLSEWMWAAFGDE